MDSVWCLHAVISPQRFLFLVLFLFFCRTLIGIVFCFFLLFLCAPNWISTTKSQECCSHQLVAAQVFYSLWGWLWVVLDGRRLWVCATAASYPRTSPQVQWQWHCTRYYCYYTTTTNTISSTYLYTFIHVRLHPSLCHTACCWVAAAAAFIHWTCLSICLPFLPRAP